MVADGDVLNIGTDRFDDTGTFMAQDEGQRDRIMLITHMKIGLTDTARDHSDENLAGARRIQIDAPDLKASTCFKNDRSVCAHAFSSRRSAELP
jgi:hypothetical protein